jgi:hypothetical protein
VPATPPAFLPLTPAFARQAQSRCDVPNIRANRSRPISSPFRVSIDEDLVAVDYRDPYPPDDDGLTGSFGTGISAAEAHRLGQVLLDAARRLR